MNSKSTNEINFRIPKWYQLDENDKSQIYSPALQIINGKNLQKTRKFGPTEKDYFWLRVPNSRLEYQQAIKVTLYCIFNFESFPFDSNQCDFSFFPSDNANYLLLNTSEIRFENQYVKNIEESLIIDQSHFPFDIWIEAIEPFYTPIIGKNYSATGMRIHFKRNNLNLLSGGFYGPTLIFVLLSLVSFSIDANMVSLETFHSKVLRVINKKTFEL